MPQDLLQQEQLEERREWNHKFVSSSGIRKMRILSREYYVKTCGSRITEIYYIDENELLRREPLSILMLHMACIPDSSFDGFSFYGERYTKEDIWKDEHEVAHFENS